MRVERPATYGGPRFRHRTASLAEEIREGRLWAPYAVDSEWSRLTDVLLYLPGPEIENVDDPDGCLLLERLNHARLSEQHDALARQLENCSVRVHHVRSATLDDRRYPNAVYQRDLFWQTPLGAVVARTASQVRAGEERHTARALAEIGVPIALSVGGRGTFEGADCIWLTADRVLCGVGVRTNEEGYAQVHDLLERNGIECIRVPVPSAVQHLLGLLQIVAPGRALVREQHAGDELLRVLREHSFEVVSVKESSEIVTKLAFNFLVVDRERVIAPSHTPEFHRLLRGAGVEIVATVEVSEYVKAAGGIACATGILARE